MDYLEFIARVTSHIPDKGQVMVRYYGLYANAHRGKVKKASLAAFPLRIIEDKLQPLQRSLPGIFDGRYFALNLTSPRAAIYTPSRWLEEKIGT
jgi:hypothetical protein